MIGITTKQLSGTNRLSTSWLSSSSASTAAEAAKHEAIASNTTTAHIPRLWSSRGQLFGLALHRREAWLPDQRGRADLSDAVIHRDELHRLRGSRVGRPHKGAWVASVRPLPARHLLRSGGQKVGQKPRVRVCIENHRLTRGLDCCWSPVIVPQHYFHADTDGNWQAVIDCFRYKAKTAAVH